MKAIILQQKIKRNCFGNKLLKTIDKFLSLHLPYEKQKYYRNDTKTIEWKITKVQELDENEILSIKQAKKRFINFKAREKRFWRKVNI